MRARPSRRLMPRRRVMVIRMPEPPLEEVVSDPVRKPGAVCGTLPMNGGYLQCSNSEVVVKGKVRKVHQAGLEPGKGRKSRSDNEWTIHNPQLLIVNPD